MQLKCKKKKKICAVDGEGAVTDRTVKSGLQSVMLEISCQLMLQSGRPVEVDSDQIETLIENNQCSTMREITNILKIFKPTKLLVKMKNASFILWKKTIQAFCSTQYLGILFVDLVKVKIIYKHNLITSYITQIFYV